MPKQKAENKKYYGLDIETHDPLLKEKGVSWIWGEGEILVTSIYDAAAKKTDVLLGNKLAPVKKLFLDKNAVIIGAYIEYDVLWICSVLGMKVLDIKAELIDIQLTEGLIDPFAEFNLDALSQKYLGIRKGSAKLEAIAKKNKLGGDFRTHLKKLKELGYMQEIIEYVKSDAAQPVQIHEKQLKILGDNLEAYKVYHKANLISMQMKQHGIRIDYERFKENEAKANEILQTLEKNFFKKYGQININAPAQLGKLFSDNGYDVKFKITVRGPAPMGGQKFNMRRDGFTKEQRKIAFDRLQGIISVFSLEKDKLFMECASDKVGMMQESLTKLGYSTIASPMVNKFTLMSAEEQVVKDYLALKQVSEIRKKFLGPKFERYFAWHDTPDGKECRIHTTFMTIGARKTGRYSSKDPNLQNIPARVVLWEKTKKEVNLSTMCREIFLPEKGHTLLRMDYSGQENRWMAYFALGEEGEFIRAKYRDNPEFDEHDFVVGSSGLLKDHAPDVARKYAKTIRFAVAYGAGVKRIAKGNNWSLDKAKVLVTKILDASPWFSSTKAEMIRLLTEGKIKGINTVLKRFIPCNEKDKAYKFYNYTIQGSSADQTKSGMVKNLAFIQKNRLENDIIALLSEHDEMVYSLSPVGLKHVRTLQKNMEEAIPVDVPFLCKPELGPNWGWTDKMEERVFEEPEEDEDDL